MKLLITEILFLSLSVSVCAQKFTSLMDGVDFIQQNDVQYWLKKNKVKSFQIEFPGFGFGYEMSSTKIIFRYDFDSINYDLKRYRVFYKVDNVTRNYCPDEDDSYYPYYETKDDELVEVAVDKKTISEFGLDEKMQDMYGVKYSFFNNKEADMIIHCSKTDSKGDTVYNIKHRHRYESYFLSYLKFEINFDEPQNNKEVILFSYLGDDYRNTLRKELYRKGKTIKYNHFHDTILYHKMSRANNKLTGIK